MEIITNGNYNNISLLDKYQWKNLNLVLDASGSPILLQKGLNTNESVILEKVDFAEGRESKSKFTKSDGSPGASTYSCTAMMDDMKVSFWLKDYQHERWATLGGIGDKVKVTCVEIPNKRVPGAKTQVLNFEAV